MKLGVAYPKPELTLEGDGEDEVIVFKPIVAEKRPDVENTSWVADEGLEPGKNASPGDLKGRVVATCMKLGARGATNVEGVTCVDLSENSSFSNLLLINGTARLLKW
ncbi:hypothetical protein GBA52_024922 [Prunus armeniaca]|nr:hypothetical protein GBA52_024922 [Prunus armeniaca]